MFAAAKARELVLVEAFMYRLRPVIHAALDLIHRGALGEVRIVRTNFTFNRPAAADDVRYQSELGGGSLWDVGCYCVHLCRSIARAEPVRSHLLQHQHEHGVDDYAAGLLEFPSGVLATFTSGMTVTCDRSTFVGGSEASLQIESTWLPPSRLILARGPAGGRCGGDA